MSKAPVQFRDDNGIVVASLDCPEITSEANEMLRKEISRKPTCDFVIDLSKVGFLSSIGVGILVTLLKRVRQQGRRLALSGLNKYSQGVMEVLGLAKVFQTYPDVAAALAALRQEQSQGQVTEAQG